MANTPFTKEAMRARLAEMTDEIAAVDAELDPLRIQHDEIANYKREEELALVAQIKELNVKRAELSNEYAILVRAVGNNVVPPASEDEAQAE